MTAKEKAMQLYKSFYPLSFKNPKECALVCINEMLCAVTTIADKKYDFYTEIKREIELL